MILLFVFSNQLTDEGVQLINWRGSFLPRSFLSNTGSVVLTFISDSSFSSIGFNMTVRGKDVNFMLCKDVMVNFTGHDMLAW